MQNIRYQDMAKTCRQYQLDRKACRTLKEKAAAE